MQVSFRDNAGVVLLRQLRKDARVSLSNGNLLHASMSNYVKDVYNATLICSEGAYFYDAIVFPSKEMYTYLLLKIS